MPDPKPYLSYGVRHDPAHQTSPPYQAFMGWCDAEGIPEETGHHITVWDETPIRAILDVYDLDGNGDKIDDGNGGYQTTPVTYNPATLPPLHNA
ncbi:hypothetical protein AB0J28_00595 [Streptosporangium canum]|uniref:hypothetical protein n=1 Tax=Streptosporangium canum TaxID=324952 RepID=UPI0034373920